MSCAICFEPVGMDHMDCEKCSTKLCLECLDLYLEHFPHSFNLPKCVNIECSGEIQGRTIKKYLPERFEWYLNLLYNKLNNDYNEQVLEVVNQIELNTQIHKKRIEYIENLPSAVRFMANSALKEKYRRILKTKRLKFDKDTKNMMVCFNSVCKGILKHQDETTFICNLCDDTFCKTCECPSHGGSCDKNVLESLKYLKEMYHCANCKVKVEKRSGCNFITCSNCGSNFHYGEKEEITNQGGHDVMFSKPTGRYHPEDFVQFDFQTRSLIEEFVNDEPRSLKYYDEILIKNIADKNIKKMYINYVEKQKAEHRSKLYFTALNKIYKTNDEELIRRLITEYKEL